MASATVSLMASTFRVTKKQQDSRLRVAELRNALWKAIIAAEEPEDSEITYGEILLALGEVQASLLQQMVKEQNSPSQTTCPTCQEHDGVHIRGCPGASVDSDEDGD